MQAAVVVLCGFAVIWSYAAIRGLDVAIGWLVLPLAISALVIGIARRTPLIGRDANQRKRARRVIRIWTLIEIAAIFLAANLLAASHHEAAIAPTVAIIVGLHFLPLAAGLPAPIYYATGALLILLGALGFFLAPVAALVLVSIGSAVVLWATAIWLIVFRREGAALR